MDPMLITATAVVTFAMGLLQPYIQAGLMRLFGKDPKDGAAHLVTVATSFVLAAAAFWATGGFAHFALPHGTWLDPSPIFVYVVTQWAPVYGISQLVYGLLTSPIQQLQKPTPAPAS